ncbi:hypothetical protein VTO42DRAFT_4176 [Malbranchea cinnamomea]
MSRNVFTRLLTGLECLRQQSRPHSWRSQSVRLFSTSQMRCDDKVSTEINLLNSLSSSSNPKPNPATGQPSSIQRLLNATNRRDMGNDLLKRISKDDLLSRVTKVTADPYSEVPTHHIHVYAHKRNTILTLSRPNREPMLTLSCGHMGFRHAQRKGYDPAHQVSSYFLAQIQERGWLHEIRALEIIYRDFGPGREAFTKVLLSNEGKNIQKLVTQVTDATRIKFGGTRSPQVRRLG